MWLKVLKYAAQGAIALGLDKKLKSWIKGKLVKAEKKVDEKLEETWDEVIKMQSDD